MYAGFMANNVAHNLAALTELHPSGCWLYTGSRNAKGYGQCGRAEGYSVGAHRRAYQLAYGAIPPGLDVHHTCHVRNCVNPEHLQAVTHQRNTQERGGADSRSLTGVRGVSRRGSRYLATCKHKGRNYYAGYHDTIAEASAAAADLRARVFNTERRS